MGRGAEQKRRADKKNLRALRSNFQEGNGGERLRSAEKAAVESRIILQQSV